MSLVPLDDVKAHLAINDTLNDVKLQAKIDAAEAWVSTNLGGAGALAPTAVTERVRGYGLRALALRHLPVVSVDSVTGSDGETLTVGTLDVDLEHGLIRWDSYGFVPFILPFYTVAYHTGYASFAALPDDIIEAVKLMSQHFWETQRGNRAGPGAGGETTGASDAFTRAQKALSTRTISPI